MIIYISILILIVGAVYFITIGLVQIKQKHRLEPAVPGSHPHRQFSQFKSDSLAKILKPLGFIIRPFSNLPYIKRLQMQAEVLKIRPNLSFLILQKIVLGMTAGILASRLLSSAVYGLAVLLAAFFIPDLIIMNKIKARREMIVRFFPETVDLMDMCINAGADFLSAVKWIIEKSNPNPFIEQLEIVLREIQVGKARIEALRDMAKRLNLVEINSFVRTMVQAERMGTSIEEAFRTLSEDTRDRRFQAGERYAIKASLKILFPLIFCILPAIMIAVAGPIIIKFTQGGLMSPGP